LFHKIEILYKSKFLDMDTITKNDLEALRSQLMTDIGNLLKIKQQKEVEVEEFGWMRSKTIRKKLNISAATLQNLRITGKIRFKKLLGSYYYNSEDLQKIFSDENE